MPSNPIEAKTPVKYSPETALAICEYIAEGMSIVNITKQPDMPSRNTIYKWLTLYPKFFDAFERAREIAAQSFEDEALDLARELTSQNDFTGTKVQAYNIAMQQLRWSAAHRDRNRYGERATANTVVPVQINTTLNLGQDGQPAVDGGRNVGYTIEFEVKAPAREQSEPEDTRTLDLLPIGNDNPGLPFGLPEHETQQLHNPRRGRPPGPAKKGVVGRPRKSEAAIKAQITRAANKAKE